MSARVFISSSSKDRDAARAICTALENRGIPCWIAHRNVNPGENFTESIVRAIRAAKVMVLVFSSNANNSEEIKKELVLAGQNKLVVIPVRVEDVAPSDALAYEFATRQWIDLFENWEQQIDRLATWISSIVSMGSTAGSDEASATRGESAAYGGSAAASYFPNGDRSMPQADTPAAGQPRSDAAPGAASFSSAVPNHGAVSPKSGEAVASKIGSDATGVVSNKLHRWMAWALLAIGIVVLMLTLAAAATVQVRNGFTEFYGVLAFVFLLTGLLQGVHAARHWHWIGSLPGLGAALLYWVIAGVFIARANNANVTSGVMTVALIALAALRLVLWRRDKDPMRWPLLAAGLVGLFAGGAFLLIWGGQPIGQSRGIDQWAGVLCALDLPLYAIALLKRTLGRRKAK